MPRRRSRRTTSAAGGTVLVAIALAILYYFRACIPDLSSIGTAIPNITPPAVNLNATPANTFPSTAKPAPVVETFKGCPPDGDGGDGALNFLKNRVDDGAYVPVALPAFLALGWPQQAERRDHDSWSPDVSDAIKKYEGAAVSAIGYLLDVKKQGPESTNCHSSVEVDHHLWLADSPDVSRDTSVVVEITPRLLPKHPEWTQSALQNLVTSRARIRISGWALFDEEHPEQLQKTRGTLWEIHPVMKIEVERGSGFAELGH